MRPRDTARAGEEASCRRPATSTTAPCTPGGRKASSRTATQGPHGAAIPEGLRSQGGWRRPPGARTTSLATHHIAPLRGAGWPARWPRWPRPGSARPPCTRSGDMTRRVRWSSPRRELSCATGCLSGPGLGGSWSRRGTAAPPAGRSPGRRRRPVAQHHGQGSGCPAGWRRSPHQGGDPDADQRQRQTVAGAGPGLQEGRAGRRCAQRSGQGRHAARPTIPGHDRRRHTPISGVQSLPPEGSLTRARGTGADAPRPPGPPWVTWDDYMAGDGLGVDGSMCSTSPCRRMMHPFGGDAQCSYRRQWTRRRR